MRHRLFTLLAVVSQVVLAASIALWVRSLWRFDFAAYEFATTAGSPAREITAWSMTHSMSFAFRSIEHAAETVPGGFRAYSAHEDSFQFANESQTRHLDSLNGAHLLGFRFIYRTFPYDASSDETNLI
ncbi:MAG TPA: hypothetical protein VH518_17100, partial [Tepidisphaeraceae bacterium]